MGWDCFNTRINPQKLNCAHEAGEYVKRDDTRSGWRYWLLMSIQNLNSDPDPNTELKEPAEQPKADGPNTAGEGSNEVKELTPEEQMAAYEEEMKNEDWGHQPC